MLDSTAVQAYRIDLESRGEGEGSGTLAGYPVIQEGPRLSEEQRELFHGLVFDSGNWGFDIDKACEFLPGVALQFEDGEENLIVLLCFSCDEWGFHLGGEVRIEDNDRARGDLLGLAKELFPDDPIIQQLR